MTVNIPARVRFALYVIAALTIPLTAYLFERGTIGEAEVTLIGAYVALVNALAASKTDTSA